MATLHELQTAFVKADDAGNTEDAQVFADSIREHPTFQKQSQDKLKKGFKALDGDERKAQIAKHTARSIGVKESDLDSERGMGGIGRLQFKAQPTPDDKLKFLEKTYGRENLNVANVGGTDQFLYRDEAETGGKWRRVDEEGVSLADFTTDLFSAAPEVTGAVVGGIKGAALGTAVAGPVGTFVGGVLGAAGGGFAAGATQDVAVRAAAGEDIQLGEIAGRRGKEALLGAGLDVATAGLTRLGGKALRSKLTGDASATAFAKVADDVGEDALTPRMMQGGKALTRELGIEGQVGGRVGDARQAIASAAERQVGEVSTESFEKFTAKATKERDDLMKSVPAGDKKLAAQVEKQYQDKLKGFGAGEGRVVSDIGDEVIRDSVEPALRASRAKKNDLYDKFDAEDAKTGGIFTAEEVGKRFDRIIAKNGMKNTSAVEKIQREIADVAEQGGKFNLKEIDDLISNVTDSMPDGLLKSRTAQQVAAELSDSLSTLVKRRAKQFPELNKAWKAANTYYKDTYTKFGRGGIGGATKDASGQSVLSGQGFIQSILGDPRQIKNLTSIAKEGGISPSVLKGRLKEAFLTSKGVQKGKPFVLSEADRGVVQELWGKRGLSRLEKIEKGMKASPEDLNAYLGAMSDKQASAARKTLEANADEAKKLDRFTENSILKQMADGDLPVENPEAISKAFLGAPDSKRKEIIKRMSDDPAAMADLRSIVGSDLLTSDLYNSGFKNAIGENVFNGKAVLSKLKSKRAAYIDALGKKEYNKLVDLADAQSRLAPLSKQEAETKLRTTFGAKGISLFIVGDMLQSIKDKVVSLAYRTRSMDKLSSGWSKADPETMKKALDAMLTGSRANRALIDMDDSEFEQDLRGIRAAMEQPSQSPQAPRGSVDAGQGDFDPEGSGYDMKSAIAAGMRRDETGHLGSRNPKTGQLLKGKNHPTFSKTVKGEKDAGYEIYKGDDGKYYSRKAGSQ